MRYRVHLDKSGETFYIDVNEVSEIQQGDEAYYLYNSQGETLFTAPLNKVIAIEKF